MKEISINEMKKLDFFKEIPCSMIQTILNQSSVVSYEKSEVIFHAKDVVNFVYIIISGKASVYNITKHGNRKIIFILGKGNLINHNILSEKPVSVFCEAVCPLKLLQIRKNDFLKWMDQEPALMHGVMRVYERYLWRMSHQLKNTTGNMYLERKIAAKLWKLGRDFGVETEEGIKIDVELTMNLLADLLGAPRENVSRACKNLSKRELLIYKNRHFILPMPDELAAFYKA
ncbi:Crp/Fnr family transcriptional regulator [uncultured Robinsoniella sp.]|uniref:Crp/Fnr family transcriptional regulator n=1 Tax=uncultured Robinsoniella sp. TaxID=904190 RepID=UPI00374FCFF1